MSEKIKEDAACLDCALSFDIFQLYTSAKVQDAKEALIVLFHVFMLDSGFIPKDVSEKDRYHCMPEKWNADQVYKISYSHFCCPEFTCCMICVPLYNKLSVHGIICSIDCPEDVNITVSVNNYLKQKEEFSNVLEVFTNVSELSRYFKDGFCLPLSNLVHETFGCLPLYGLQALFDEIKMYILRLLPVQDVLSMSAVNRKFNDLANSSHLWKHLFIRDFTKGGVPDIDIQNSETNWKQLYKTEYMKTRQRRQQRDPWANGWSSHHLPQIFPVGPDFEEDLSYDFNPPFPEQFLLHRDVYPLLPPRPSHYFRRLI